MTCPQEPIPAGWRVWRGSVPPELTQIAMDVRDHVRQYARGTIVQTLNYNGQTVGVFVSSHTWTYRKQADGSVKLVTGICIPGVSLLTQPPGTGAALGAPDDTTPPDDLSTPDPDMAVFGADDVPIGALVPLGSALAGAVAGFVCAGPVGALAGALIGATMGWEWVKNSNS